MDWGGKTERSVQLGDNCIIQAKNDKILSQSNISGNGQIHFLRIVTDWMCEGIKLRGWDHF